MLASEKSALAVHQHAIAVDHTDLGVCREHARVALQCIRPQAIVAVEKYDGFAGARLEAPAARRHDARVRLREHAQPCVFDRARTGQRGIGRAVVDDDDLEIRHRLRQRAADGIAYVALAAVSRDDDSEAHATTGRSGALDGLAACAGLAPRAGPSAPAPAAAQIASIGWPSTPDSSTPSKAAKVGAKSVTATACVRRPGTMPAPRAKNMPGFR